MKQFQLDTKFVNQFNGMPTKFGFDGLGEIVYRRSYSRLKADGVSHEEWFETVERVVNGTFNMQLKHCSENSLPLTTSKLKSKHKKCMKRYFT